MKTQEKQELIHASRAEKNQVRVNVWEERKNEKETDLVITVEDEDASDNGLSIGIKGSFDKKEDYYAVLSAQVFEVFGVTSPQLALSAMEECINCVSTYYADLDMGESKKVMQKYCDNILALFHEMRPRDGFDLMMVTKMIMLHFLSNREFKLGASARSENLKSMEYSRAIKLSRLFLAFKEKLDKHRKPEQQIFVQHNHIHNEGQAIIGSQLNAGRG